MGDIARAGDLEVNIVDHTSQTKMLVNADGSTISHPYGLMVSNGEISNKTFVNKFGRNTDVDIGTSEDVWDAGGMYPWLTSATTLAIASTSVNDTSAGTGARTVEIDGLDSSYDVQSETVTMNGTTDVTTANSYLRIHRMKVLTAGTGEENEGDITATASSAVRAQISATFNQSLMAIYTVPNGFNGFLMRLFASIVPAGAAGGNRTGAVFIFIREPNAVFQVKLVFGLSDQGNTLTSFSYTTPDVIPPKSDIRITFGARDNNTEIAAGFDLLLEATGA